MFFLPKLNNSIYDTASLYFSCLSLPLILPFSICHLHIICLLIFFPFSPFVSFFPFPRLIVSLFLAVGVVSSGSSLDTEETDCIVHQGKEGSLQICKPLNFVFDAFLLRSEMLVQAFILMRVLCSCRHECIPPLGLPLSVSLPLSLSLSLPLSFSPLSLPPSLPPLSSLSPLSLPLFPPVSIQSFLPL